MNRRDFMGLFGKALAGAAIVPGVAGSVGLPVDIEGGVYPVNIQWSTCDHPFGVKVSCLLKFSDGEYKRYTFEFDREMFGRKEEAEAIAKPLLQQWAAETCREYCGVAA